MIFFSLGEIKGDPSSWDEFSDSEVSYARSSSYQEAVLMDKSDNDSVGDTD